MNRYISFVVLCGLVNLCHAEDGLPQPHYHRQTADPAWLANVVQFHGHLGPSVVAGARMGMIGLRAVEAKGYFDVEVTYEGPLAKPPQSCFLDGVQVATGATLGKRTIQWLQADRLTMRIKNTQTGKIAVLRPTPALLELLASFKPEAAAGHGHRDDEQLEAIARKIAAMPDKEIAVVALPALVAENHDEAEKQAVAAAESWLALVDDGKYGQGWVVAADYLKNAISKDAFEKSMKAARKPLGKVKSREVKSKDYRTSLPGAPDGEYVVIQFNTSFEDKKAPIETITPMLAKDGKWTVSGYFIR
jgi:formylmethanofuran dehydrogenase subunit E